MHMWSNQGLGHRCRILCQSKALNKPTYVDFISNFHSSQFALNLLIVSLSWSLNWLPCDMINCSHVSRNIRSWLVAFVCSKESIYMEPLRHIEVEKLDKWHVQKLGMTIGITPHSVHFETFKVFKSNEKTCDNPCSIRCRGNIIVVVSMGSRMVKWATLDPCTCWRESDSRQYTILPFCYKHGS